MALQSLSRIIWKSTYFKYVFVAELCYLRNSGVTIIRKSEYSVEKTLLSERGNKKKKLGRIFFM
jgi:hypothetical protein